MIHSYQTITIKTYLLLQSKMLFTQVFTLDQFTKLDFNTHEFDYEQLADKLNKYAERIGTKERGKDDITPDDLRDWSPIFLTQLKQSLENHC